MSTIIFLLGLAVALAIIFVAAGLVDLARSVGPWSRDPGEYDDGQRRQRKHLLRQRPAGPGLRVQRSFQVRRDVDPEHSLMRRAADHAGGEGG